VLALLFAISGSQCLGDDLSHKVHLLGRVQSVYGQLVELANECRRLPSNFHPEQHQEWIQDRVDKVVSKVEDPQVLWRVAILSFISAYPEDAGNERVDLVFDFAWTHSVQKIAVSKAPDALEALQTIDQQLKLDAAGALLIEESLEKLKKQSKS